MIHNTAHPLAGQTVTIQPRGGTETCEYTVEDWADRVLGQSWMFMDGNPAAISYAIRAGGAGITPDNNVLYGKIGPYGHLIHTSEVLEP